MPSQQQWTTTQAARLLKQPTHRIIYLFDNHVVERPEHEPRGRGSSRLLSSRNLLELAVATTMWRLNVPTGTSRKLLDALRGWEQRMTAEDFALPRSVEEDGGPTVRLILDQNGAVYVAIGRGAEATRDRSRRPATGTTARARGRGRPGREHPTDSGGPRAARRAGSRST